VYAVPHVAGTILDPGSDSSATGTVRISLVQPDIDPFQKWEGEAESQVELLKRMTRDIADTSSPDLIVWPETAIPYYVLSPARRPEADGMRAFVDSLGIPLLTGIPDITYYDTSGVLPPGVKISWDGRPFQNYNSSML
jgi:apolipoprotein N-acyltransferase